MLPHRRSYNLLSAYTVPPVNALGNDYVALAWPQTGYTGAAAGTNASVAMSATVFAGPQVRACAA